MATKGSQPPRRAARKRPTGAVSKRGNGSGFMGASGSAAPKSGSGPSLPGDSESATLEHGSGPALPGASNPAAAKRASGPALPGATDSVTSKRKGEPSLSGASGAASVKRGSGPSLPGASGSATPKRESGPALPTAPGAATPFPNGQDLYSLSELETLKLGEALGRTLTPGTTVLLVGELGTGKTVFARGIASSLGIDPRDVGSPTFILVDRHIGRLTMYHADLYRLDRTEDVFDLGLDEFAEAGAVVVVEWGEKMPTSLRLEAIEVRFTDLGDDSRRVTITSLGAER